MSKQSWKTKTFKELRNVQDHSLNSGWQIKFIFHTSNDTPIIIGFENWARCLAGISIIGFLVCIIMSIKDQDSLGIYIAVTSFSVMGFSSGMKNFLRKIGYLFVTYV